MSKHYARIIEASKRARFDIDADVIRGRGFDLGRKFLPDSLALTERFDTLGAHERRREDAKLDAAGRDAAVGELIELAAGVDGIVQMQASADAGYFSRGCGRAVLAPEAEKIRAAFLAAYRWQYIVSGVREPRFGAILASLTTAAQRARIGAALAPIHSGVGSIEQRLAA